MNWVKAALVGNACRDLLAGAFLLLFACCAWSAQSAGAIKTLVGQATIAREATVLVAVPGQKVFPGDRISVSTASYVGITLHDDTRITIGPGSEVLIQEFEFNTTSYMGRLTVSFLSGTARVVTGLMSKHAPDRVN